MKKSLFHRLYSVNKVVFGCIRALGATGGLVDNVFSAGHTVSCSLTLIISSCLALDCLVAARWRWFRGIVAEDIFALIILIRGIGAVIVPVAISS